VSIDVIARAAGGPFAVVCVVLAFAGVAKIRRPRATRPAAAAVGLPATAVAVRLFGTLELIVAVAGLAVGRAAAVVVAAMFAALAVVAWRLRARAPETPCGCLGAADAPVGAVHIVVNVAAALAAALAASAGSPLAAAGPGLWSRAAFVLLVGCGAALLTAALETLPVLTRATNGEAAR
jgi:hypothetical protein